MAQPLTRNEFIKFDATSEENKAAPDGWKRVVYLRTLADPGVPGWIEVRYIGPALDFVVSAVDEDKFVRDCARAEILANSANNDGAPAILADYLIAWALIESNLVNFGRNLPGTSAVGPFQITEEEWAEFRAANPHAGYGQFQLYEPLAQIVAAQYLTQRDWDALTDEAKANAISAPKQEYVPSFLMLFHARLLGATAAFAIDHLHAKGQGQTSIETVLTPFLPVAEERNTLFARRGKFLPQGGATTLDEFLRITSDRLNEAFKAAFGKLKQHFPEFANPPIANGPVWLDIARAEEKQWSEGGWTEFTAPGVARVLDYFKATEFRPRTVKPWCGAFVAWCLKKAGQQPVASAATASSWKTWGSVELRKGGLDDPGMAAVLPGAIVVLHRQPGTNSTGHVCFALEHTGGKIKCLGGNQSNRVRVDAFDLNQVATIRVMTALTTPDGDDQLIVARTLYGEARGEPIEGQEAVVEVIANRAASGKYPSSLSGVCLDDKQFSCWNADDSNRSKISQLQTGAGNTVFDQLFELVGKVLANPHKHLPRDVLHYHATTINKPDWVRDSPGAIMVEKIGNHLFYSGIK